MLEDDNQTIKKIEEELNCRFIRVTDENSDSYNCALVIKEIFNL